MYDLTKLSLQNATDIGTALRGFGQGADSLETVATQCVRYFYDSLIDPQTGQSNCALVRFFKTHAYGNLPVELQHQVSTSLGQPEELAATVQCLTLLATAGDRPAWNSRHTSQGHQAIPLTHAQGVQAIPMISQLIDSFGLEINSIIALDTSLLMKLEHRTCNVFYIPQAIDSEYIPAQHDFVIPYGIKSVLGFGGILPSGNLFTIILFAKVAIPETTAQLFKTLPLNIKMAIIPFDHHQTFQEKQTISHPA